MSDLSELQLSSDLMKIIEDEHIETVEELIGLLGSSFKAKLSYKQIEALYDALHKAGLV